jgi:hypothetical protein
LDGVSLPQRRWVFEVQIFIHDSTYHALDLGVPGRRTRVGLLPHQCLSLEPHSDTVAMECRPPALR